MKNVLLVIVIMLAVASASYADVEVKTEQLNPADAEWAFKAIPGPSKSDIASDAQFRIVGNKLAHSGAQLEALSDGELAGSGNHFSEVVFFHNDNRNKGKILIDLGKVQKVSAFCTYSWHEWNVDHGSRAPQVYTLYGSKENADYADLSKWTKIADVDSRPNKTGEKWNGQHGVVVSDSKGSLGEYRYLLMVVSPTLSPKQSNTNWTQTFFTEIDVHTDKTLPKAGDAEPSVPVKVTDVYVVFKTHLDIGYTHLIEDVLKKYRVDMMENALKIIESGRSLPKDDRFSWTLPGWVKTVILGPEEDPKRKKRIEEAIRNGELVFHALPATLHTESLDYEDLVRGLTFSVDAAKEYGMPVSIAGKMTDVPEHSWVLPTLLKHAGIEFMHIGCNTASAYPRLPRLFWWEGPDGSRLLSAYSTSYGTGIIPPADWPSKNYLAMIMSNDNQGPPHPNHVANLRKQAERKLPGVRIHFGTLDDFARAVLKEQPGLKVVRGDTPDTWIHGYNAMPIASKLARNTRPLGPALDILDTQLNAWGIETESITAKQATAYEKSMLYGEHTCGLNGAYGGRTIWGLQEWKKQMPRDRQEGFHKSFEDKRDHIRTSDKIWRGEIEQRLALLADSIKADGKSIVVYNALPWKRSGLVEIGNKKVLVEDVPACGYKTLRIDQSDRTGQSDLTDGSLETQFYKVTFDLKRGGMSSLVCKKTGRELVDKSSEYALGQFLHERFSLNEVNRFLKLYLRGTTRHGPHDFGKLGMPKDVKYAKIVPSDWKMAVSESKSSDVVILTAGDTKGLAKAFKMKFTFAKHEPFVEVEWKVDTKTPDKIPEGGWLCFPFAVKDPKFTVGRPGGPIDPAKDIIPGSARHLMAVMSGVAVTGRNGQGMGVCSLDSSLLSMGIPGLYQFSLDYVPTISAIFVNLYNNEWNTNFPLWTEGSWRDRVRLWPIGKGSVTEDLAVKSWEARVPLLTAKTSGKKGTLPESRQGLSLSRKGVLVTAFGKDPYGAEGTLLRVWEQAGESGEITVEFPKGMKVSKATPVNLRGEKTGKAKRILFGRLEFELGAYTPASFILE